MVGHPIAASQNFKSEDNFDTSNYYNATWTIKTSK